MRRVLLLALCVTSVLAFGACKPKVKPGECKSSADCEKQEGYGKVCVEGRCQECAADADCKEGFTCVANRCEPKPTAAACTTDDQCPPGQSCASGQCIAREPGTCGSDRDCGPDEQCQAGRCAARAAAVSPECSDAGKFTVRFGFDQSNLSGDSQGTLQKLADCLKSSPAKRIVAEGFADERGTAQYNIALGNRRAETARKYLEDLGVSGKMETVSFGEEQALCGEATEACWAQNRRVQFQVER